MERVQRFVFEHRRLLAAAFAGLAVLIGITSVRDSPVGVDVVVAARDLASGAVLGPDDVRTASLPPASIPAGAASDPADVVGRQVAAPMREHEMLTDRRLLDPRDLSAYGEGLVLAAVRVAAEEASMLRAGDQVDVVALDPGGEHEAAIVAQGAEVVAVPPATDQGVALQVAVTQSVALELATASVSARFSVLATTSTAG